MSPRYQSLREQRNNFAEYHLCNAVGGRMPVVLISGAALEMSNKGPFLTMYHQSCSTMNQGTFCSKKNLPDQRSQGPDEDLRTFESALFCQAVEGIPGTLNR